MSARSSESGEGFADDVQTLTSGSPTLIRGMNLRRSSVPLPQCPGPPLDRPPCSQLDLASSAAQTEDQE